MKISPRNLLAWALSYLLIILGFVERVKKKAMKGEFILSIYFHDPSKKEFEDCVKWLLKNKFVFLSDTDLDNIANQRVLFPKGAVFLSVDDGWKSNEENIVEVAKKYNIPVTIFVSTEPVEEGTYWWSFIPSYKQVQSLKQIPNKERLFQVNERKKEISLEREAFSVDQVRKIAGISQITIGGHTHTHPILPQCDDETVYNELKISKEKLEGWIEKDVTLFAYPNGDFGKREKEMLKSLNYKYGFSNKPLYLTHERLKDPYEIPRFGFLEGGSFAENICRMTGVWQSLVQARRISKTTKKSHLDIFTIFQKNIRNKPNLRQLWKSFGII